MRLSDFDFELPEELLAKFPSTQRDQSRLMVIDRKSGSIAHHIFCDLPQFFESDDALVLNNTRVLPARMVVRKNNMQGANIELLLVRKLAENRWEVMLDPMRKLKLGQHLIFGNQQLKATIVGTTDERKRIIEFENPRGFEQLDTILQQLGEMPLPPYIKRKRTANDFDRYQTVYAQVPGSLAAPTAGLHFTPEVMNKMKKKGVHFPMVTLHIGMGTFAAIHAEDFQNHKMHTETFELSSAAASTLCNTRQNGNKICCVGTTALRTLESTLIQKGRIAAHSGTTDLFIYPPMRVKSTDCLLTNFHTPKSSLLMLVAAFAGYDLIRDAYREAIRERYRFFSYGDAMLIL